MQLEDGLHFPANQNLPLFFIWHNAAIREIWFSLSISFTSMAFISFGLALCLAARKLTCDELLWLISHKKSNQNRFWSGNGMCARVCVCVALGGELSMVSHWMLSSIERINCGAESGILKELHMYIGHSNSHSFSPSLFLFLSFSDFNSLLALKRISYLENKRWRGGGGKWQTIQPKSEKKEDSQKQQQN